MTYAQTLEWLFAQLPMYQQQGASAYKKDLTNTLLLTEYLGHPERLVRCIHVAGTNGKGSTSHMIASVLQEAGYKTGLYTSPHLKDFRERIKIDGRMIPEDFVTGFVARHQDFFERNAFSFFEMTVGLAFDYFRQEQVDFAVIETGLGGRLDSTNVITPLVSTITNIGLDHVQFLGNTLEAIATEKAGIIKPGVPVVIGQYTPATKAVFARVADTNQSPIYFASDLIADGYQSDLKGDYQFHNKKTAVQTLNVLREHCGVAFTDAHLIAGLQNVVHNTGLLGRWQQLGQNPTIIADTAHNADGLKMVLNQLLREKYQKLHIILGVVNDKDLDEILPLFPKNAIYYFCRPNLPRGLDAAALQSKASRFGLNGHTHHSVTEAYQNATLAAGPEDLIYAGGSTFVVAEIL